MICVQLNGGLGNQMFQYACGRALAYRHQTDLVFDTSPLNTTKAGITPRSFGLDVFGISKKEPDNRELKKIKPFIYRIINTISFKLLRRGIQTPNYFIENEFAYNPAIENIESDVFLSGYWQSPKYFQFIEQIIRQDFSFPDTLSSQNAEWLDEIRSSNSISLHVRRTDFVNNVAHDIHGFCSLDYYKEAIDIISNKTKDPIFFIFSDDIEWAKKNIINHSGNSVFVSGNSGSKSYVDMQLMSSCKHNIIANSSFSWWGAWLNTNDNKIVIAPKKWFTVTKLNDQTVDLIPSEWIRI